MKNLLWMASSKILTLTSKTKSLHQNVFQHSIIKPAHVRYLASRRRMGDENPGPTETIIRTKLTDALKPVHLEVINESYMHNVPKGTESHFKVVIVSEAFENVKRIQKHQLVHKVLESELVSLIHAFSIVAKTPAEWEKNSDTGKSPPCKGGAGL